MVLTSMKYTSLVVVVALFFLGIWAPVHSEPTHSATVPLSTTASSGTYVILVHGYNPGDTSGTPSTGTWTCGVSFESQLVSAGYTVGVVSYYGEFTIAFSNGYAYSNSSFFGTSNTPIQNIGSQLGIAMSKIFTSGTTSVDIVAHSMGGLVTLYALEHYYDPHIALRNVIFIATPFGGSPFASVAQFLGLSGVVGCEANQMVSGSSFLTGLQNNLGNAYSNYPGFIWTVFAGNYDPWWGYLFFSGGNDGVVSVNSAAYLGYNSIYVFPDLHTGSLDGYTWYGISYFQDQSVANTMLSVLGT